MYTCISRISSKQFEKTVNKKNNTSTTVTPENKTNILSNQFNIKDVKSNKIYNNCDINPNQITFKQKTKSANQSPKKTDSNQSTGKVTQSLSAGGVFQELSYKIKKEFKNTPEKKKTSNFNLSFRDKSGFSKPTSQLYLNRTIVTNNKGDVLPTPKEWKGLRLDYGYNKKTTGINWHWNQSGTGSTFKTTDGVVITDHELLTNTEKVLGKTLKVVKPLARTSLVIGVGLDAYSLTKEVNKSSTTGNWKNTSIESARIAGGWTGAYLGAETLGSLGASMGVVAGPVGIAIGGATGGFVGGTLGYFSGSSVAKYTAKKVLN